MSGGALDRERMLQALDAARGAIGVTEPNPRVGCVIGSDDGRVFAVGATQKAGDAHAEVMALRAARAAGTHLRGATAWVTLEPCAHHGRTPPCCDALVEAEIGRVVVAVQDPFPRVAGEGIARLRAARVRVDMADPDLAQVAWELNIGFFSRALRGRPWVRVKVAATLDGRTALESGASQWITGEAARADGHAWRHRASAVLTGIGTVLADDPRLDVRLVPAQHQPLRVVVDSALRTPLGARVLTPPGQTLVVAAMPDAGRADALRARGAEVIALPGADSRVDLPALAFGLARRGVNELHVEGGARLVGALLQAGLVDEVLAFIAPRLLGPGRGMADRPPLQRLADSHDFRFLEHALVGDDLRLRLVSTAGGVIFGVADALRTASGNLTDGHPRE